MISQNRRSVRQPRETEKRWNSHNVDKNLEEDWLISLNSLKAFNLISICEGHVNTRSPGRNRPHFNLRIKERFIPLYINIVDKDAYSIQNKMAEIFNTELSRINLEFKITLNPSRAMQYIRRDLTIRIESMITRYSEKIEYSVIEWFNNTIDETIKFDGFIYETFA
jgi:hypothetical protein